MLVDVDAAGVGYVDVMALRGEYAYFPARGGAGPGGRRPGDGGRAGRARRARGRRVLALPAFGGFAERAVADADRVFPIPRGDGQGEDEGDADTDAVDTVALGVNALVAEIGLHRAGVAAGERVLVRGAGGGIGVLATQIAHAHGAEVTAITSSPARGERLRGLGAAHVVDRTAAAPPRRPGRATGPRARTTSSWTRSRARRRPRTFTSSGPTGVTCCAAAPPVPRTGRLRAAPDPLPPFADAAHVQPELRGSTGVGALLGADRGPPRGGRARGRGRPAPPAHRRRRRAAPGGERFALRQGRPAPSVGWADDSDAARFRRVRWHAHGTNGSTTPYWPP
ncbi:zinc-binding dehydrogenase [Streptomyces sp. M19]